MGQGRYLLLFAVVAGLAALAVGGPAAASPSCSSRLLADWRDGRIDGTYPVACYRQALESLPEDVRVYSTAESDITRALQARLAVLVLAVRGAVFVGAGSLAAIAS